MDQANLIRSQSVEDDNELIIPRLWKEELESDPKLATSANSYSWIIKGQITKEFLSGCHLSLNVGCGFGRELFHLSDRAIGLDIDLHLVKKAKKISRKEVICTDAHYLPFRSNIFDGLAVAEVIEHLRSPILALSEMHRVLAPRGKIVLQTPNKVITFGLAISKRYGHIREFTYREISHYMRCAGFVIWKRTGSTIPYVPSTSRFAFLNEGSAFLLWKWINKYLKIVSWDIIILGFKSKDRK
jgi:SAM-dependent methyltransferase